MAFDFGSESNISSTRLDGVEKIVVREKPMSTWQAVSILPLFFFLVIWVQTEFGMLAALLSAQFPAYFVIVSTGWLGLWTYAGAGIIWVIFRILRPRPAILTLGSDGFVLDTGSPRPQFRKGLHHIDDRHYRRKLIDIDRKALSTLQLRIEPGNNRLTIDVGNERIDIAATATEIERERLYAYLAARYHLTGPGAGLSAAQ